MGASNGNLAALFMQLVVAAGLLCADLVLVLAHLRLSLRETSSRKAGQIDAADGNGKPG